MITHFSTPGPALSRTATIDLKDRTRGRGRDVFPKHKTRDERVPSDLSLPTIREVVVPVDGSEFAEHALPWAIQIADRAKARIRLVHIHPQLGRAYHDPAGMSSAQVDQLLRKPKELYLTALTRRLSKAGVHRVKSLLLDGSNVATTLADLVAESDLVVMASRRRGPLGQFTVASVADRLIRESTTPLLMVRGCKCQVDLTAKPVLRHALIPLNGDPDSEAILPSTASLSRVMDGEQTLVNVVPNFGPLSTAAESIQITDGACVTKPAPLMYLQDVANRWKAAIPRTNVNLVWSDKPVGRQIVKLAEESEADYISLAVRPRKPLWRILRPGVGDYILRHSPVPVLLVNRL